LCANHHKVVDDDEESYTVERLRAMKSAHESRTVAMLDSPEIEAVAQQLIVQAVTTFGQSGGLTAHTITAIRASRPLLRLLAVANFISINQHFKDKRPQGLIPLKTR
jgi:hypothetical protein